MSNKLTELVKKIQYLKGWTIEQVAQSIDYTRPHLSKEMKKGNDVIEKLLEQTHSDILQNVTSFEVDKDEIIKNLSAALANATANSADLQARLSSMEKLLQIVVKNQQYHYSYIRAVSM